MKLISSPLQEKKQLIYTRLTVLALVKTPLALNFTTQQIHEISVQRLMFFNHRVFLSQV